MALPFPAPPSSRALLSAFLMNSGLRECVAVLSQSRASDCQFGQGIRLGPRFRQMKWNIVVPAERRGETPTCGKASASFRGRAGRDGKEFRRQRFLSAAARSNRLEKQTGKLNFPREGKHPRDSPRFTGSRIPSLSFPPLSLSLSLAIRGASAYRNGFVGTFRAAPSQSREKLGNLDLTL